MKAPKLLVQICVRSILSFPLFLLLSLSLPSRALLLLKVLFYLRLRHCALYLCFYYYLTYFLCLALSLNYLLLSISVTEFGEILLLCQNFTSIRQFLSVYFLFGKMLRLLWRICYIVGLIFIVENGQIVKNSIDIWSHWFLCLTVRHHSLFLQRHPIFLSLSLCMSLISLSLSFVR